MPPVPGAVPDPRLSAHPFRSRGARGPWGDRDFRRLWACQTASQVGEHATLVLLPLLAVVTLHVGPGELGVLRAVGQAPVLLLALFVGAWVDGWRTRTVMMTADAGRALLLIVVAAGCLVGGLDGPSLPVLYALAFAVGALSVYFDVAYQASAVRLVAPDRLTRSNAALEGSRSAAQIGGPALGGALVSLGTAPVALGSAALFFAGSYLSARSMRRTEPVPGAAGGKRAAGRPVRVGRRIAEGVRLVVGDGSLRTVCLASAAFQFFLAATMTVYLLFLPRELGLSGSTVGLVLAATGPGALAGSLLAARLPARLGHGPVLVGAAAIGDGALLAVPALHGSGTATIAVLVLVNLVFGAFGQLVNVTVMGIRQAVTPHAMQGRVAATITCLGMGLTPFGSLLGGFLGLEWGLRAGLLAAAAGMMLSPLLMLLSPLARLGRTLPPRSVSPAAAAGTDPR